MRVLGIDCGTQRTGYGVIDSDGRAHRMIAAGVIRTAAKSPLESRLQEISRELDDVGGARVLAKVKDALAHRLLEWPDPRACHGVAGGHDPQFGLDRHLGLAENR